jgi:hypothetical protein
MDIEKVRARLTPYSKVKGLKALVLSPSELKLLRINTSTGVWLDMERRALSLGDPEIVVIFRGGICIQCDREGLDRMDCDDALELIASVLTEE